MALRPGDPLLLVAADSVPPDAIFWLRYVKGAARTCSLLLLAYVAMRQGWDLPLLCPYLQESMLAIYCRQELFVADAESLAFANAKLSARGSIRRAHCVLTWLGVFQSMKVSDSGPGPSDLIKRWNAQSTREGQLQGAKRAALLQLLSLKEDSVSLLLRHLSDFGSGTAFPEDAFSHKRLLPGGCPRGVSVSSKDWNTRLTVTVRGFNTML